MRFLGDPVFMKKFHGGMTFAWGILIVPSVLFWKDSVPWLVLMSCYANFVGHWSSFQASSSEESQEDPGVKLRRGKK